TVQDLGRPNAMAAGVPPGGAMDRFAHSAANLLAGNDVRAATLECTLTGPRLVAERSCLVAITGADLDPRINGEPAPMWTGIFLSAGDRLTLATRRSGARAYVAVAGGVDAGRWLGSQSTYLLAARGGMHGRALVAGDTIAVAEGSGSPAVAGRELPHHLRPDYDDHALRAVAGPHIGRLGPDGRRALFASVFTVSHRADRMGYRLDGPDLDSSGEELLSFGLTAGVVQLPAGGKPILLMADQQTVGGYPVIATVVRASLPIAAQLAPGDELRFAEVAIEEALRMRRAQESALDSLRD
ncbi:MAG TPA: biotin-dependent carboxyltransferase family protein, partial [Candidatus Dormibacteraeota bacterium]|nr:biotin-dependent carboxyltransferase family protein [Candidatus Dormibacteraeota bacterium]